MPYRKTKLAENELYHICSKSIAGFKIFSSDKEYSRMLELIRFYSLEKPPCKFSLYENIVKGSWSCPIFDTSKKIVQVVAYCLMPTHIHILIQQLKKNGISNFVNLILKSYSKYFNIKIKRKGPLWEGPFRNVLIETDEQFLHTTRYMHLNPVTERLVEKPENWEYSSYKEYLKLIKTEDKICDFSDYFNMESAEYRRFVNDGIQYQRELAKIKHLFLE